MEKSGIAKDDAAQIATTLFQWGVSAAVDRMRPTRPAPADLPQLPEQASLIAEAAQPKPAKTKRPAMVKRRIPDDFALTADLITFARERGFAEARIRKMFDDFVNYYRASGKTWADWNAVWRTWVNRERDRLNMNSGPDNPQNGGSFL